MAVQVETCTHSMRLCVSVCAHMCLSDSLAQSPTVYSPKLLEAELRPGGEIMGLGFTRLSQFKTSSASTDQISAPT